MGLRTTHDFLAFPSALGKSWWGVFVSNVGANTIFPGRAVLPKSNSTASGIAGHVTRTYGTERHRVIGIAQETIAAYRGVGPYPSGYVAHAGYLTNLLVTGAITKIPALLYPQQSAARPGILTATPGTITTTRLPVALAMTTQADGPGRKVRGLLPMWKA